MKNTFTQSEIDHLIARFEAETLPKAEWTHNAHLIMAIVYSSRFEGDRLIKRTQTQIMRYNVSVGGENTDTAGYHHSITVFWLWVATEFLKANADLSLAAACNAFIASPYADRAYPLAYYSKAHLFSVEARRAWVAPDLREMHALILPKA